MRFCFLEIFKVYWYIVEKDSFGYWIFLGVKDKKVLRNDLDLVMIFRE